MEIRRPEHAARVTFAVLLFLVDGGHLTGNQAQAASPKKQQETPTAALPSEQRADAEDASAADREISAFEQRKIQTGWHALMRGANPGVRAYIIDRLPSSNAILALQAARRINTTKDAGERAGLIMMLGGFSETQLPRWRRTQIAPILLRIYRNDPDPEVHSSIDWLLRHTNNHPTPEAFSQEDYPFLHSAQGVSQPRPEWGQERNLEAIDREISHRVEKGRGWTVNAEGLTMISVHPGQPFAMGSPSGEPRRDLGETQHLVRIPRTFSISSKEVSTEQFERYLSETGRKFKWLDALRQRFPNHPERFTDWPHNPQFATVWYDAVSYCNWLSEREGIAHDQWVYPDEIGPGMSMHTNYLHRTGYRLPTEAEWEYAARAGTETAHFFGNGVALLDRYAWFMGNSENHGWPVGTTKPNQFGLFDMYGNAWEWVQDRYLNYSADLTESWIDDEDTSLDVSDNAKRVRRGGSFSYDKETMRSAHRGAPSGYQLNNRMDSVGFRVARTVSSLP